MKVSVGKYLFQALSAIQGLQIRPVQNVTDAAFPTTPYLVYQRTSFQPNYTKNLWTGETTFNYTITIVDDDYESTADMVQQVADIITGLSHTEAEDIRFNQVLITDSNEDFENGLFLQIISFEINTTIK